MLAAGRTCSVAGRGLRRSARLVAPKRALMRPARVTAGSDKGSEAISAAVPPGSELDADSVFTDSFLRCFLLGVGSGLLAEGGHMAWQYLGLHYEDLHQGLLQGVAGVAESLSAFAPAIVWDHVAALGAWLLVYVLEVTAIMSVLERFPDDAAKAARMVSSMNTYSKLLVPLKLSSLKRALYSVTKPRTLAGAAAGATAAVQPEGNVMQFRGGSIVLDREVEEIEAAARAPLPPMPRLPNVPLGPEGRTQRKVAEVEAERRAKLARDRTDRQLAPGAWDPETQKRLRRDKELAQRKAYLKNFWYAAALSQDVVAGKPHGVDILGFRVVLFRDEASGQVACIDDTCPHRGAPLSGGWLAEDEKSGHTCVVCPYHGWAFDGEGKLRDVPSAEPGRWPKRPVLNKYPVVERGGFVWLFYGDKALPAEERPPIPFCPELEDPAWQAVYGEMEFDCPHWPVFENAIDMAHIHYLHSDSFGNESKPRVMDMQFREDTFHIEGSFRIHNKPVNKLWEWTAVDSVPVTARAMLPSSSCIGIQLGAGVQMITFVNTVPIDENRAINRFCLIRNFAGWDGFDGWARSAMYKILGEDKVMVEKLHPERLDQEYSLGPDAPQIAFRKLRQKWVDMGYAVAPRANAPGGGQTSLFTDIDM